ncbi:hypothetical protein PVIIG_05450 [Plasmodium vivax India VII]|uniref:PIR Superfamily Protein n=1 Tax=Plasmodium vivax India VII TaxID=1077284 RepID=A0A0J9S2U4_PLAVI|nr:hypothetical protein PVIIG_05450 [Plasmodium vivax India VII]
MNYAINCKDIDISVISHIYTNCDELQVQLSKYPNFNKFCYKFTRNIVKVIVELSDTPNVMENFNFLNYWIYDQVGKNNFYVNNCDLSESNVIVNIPVLWDNYDEKYKGKFETYRISVSDYNHLKSLYDCSQDYIILRSSKHICENISKTYCCSYIDEVKPGCSNPNGATLCDLFKHIEEAKNSQELLEHVKRDDNDIDKALLKY